MFRDQLIRIPRTSRSIRNGQSVTDNSYTLSHNSMLNLPPTSPPTFWRRRPGSASRRRPNAVSSSPSMPSLPTHPPNFSPIPHPRHPRHLSFTTSNLPHLNPPTLSSITTPLPCPNPSNPPTHYPLPFPQPLFLLRSDTRVTRRPRRARCCRRSPARSPSTGSRRRRFVRAKF